MQEYRVEWTKCPTMYNSKHVLFVEAATPDDAKAIVRDHVERKLGVGEWLKIEVSEAPTVPAGRVLP